MRPHRHPQPSLYINFDTGAALYPKWKHRGCGGTVISDQANAAFTCLACHTLGKIGVHVEVPDDVPENERRAAELQYLLDHSPDLEVDLLTE